MPDSTLSRHKAELVGAETLLHTRSHVHHLLRGFTIHLMQQLHERTISEQMGLSKPEIQELKREVIDKAFWSKEDTSLLELTDELVQSTSVSDAVFEQAIEYFSEAELIEMTQLVGLYTSVAMLVSLIRPELDPY